MSKTLDTRAAAKPNIAAPPAHDHGQDANSRMLLLALLLTGTFLIAEVIGSFVFNSLALLSDAGHMLTEIGRASCRERVCSVRVDLGGRRVSKKKKKTSKNSR